MPVSDHEERGIKLLARHSSDVFAGIPLKKRRFPLVRSPSPPPGRPSLLPGDCDLPQSKPSILEPELSVSDVGGEMPISGNADPFWEHKGEPVDDEDAKSALTYESFSGSNHRQLLTSVANAGMERYGGGILSWADKSAVGTVLAKGELRSTQTELLKLSTGEGSGEGKLIPSNTSAFHRVLGNTDLQFPSRGGSYLKQEKLDPCPLNLALAKGQHDVHDVQSSSDVEYKVDSALLQTNRTHWDLNTMMDTWEGSLSDADVNNGVGGDDGSDLGNIHEKKLETCLRLSNSASYPKEQHTSETYLNLQLNPASGSQSHLSGVTSPLAKPNAVREVSGLHVSVKPMIPTTDFKLATVKAEPLEGSSIKDTTVFKTVKPEPVVGGIQESPQTIGRSTLTLACGRAVKSEPQVFPQQGFKTLEGQAWFTEFHTHNMETPFREMHQDAKPNVFKPLDLVSQSIVNDGNNIHHGPEMPTNVPIQLVACETVSRISNLVMESLVADTCKSVQSPGTSINADTPHNASEILDNAKHLVSEYVVLDVNSSQNDQVMPINAVIHQDTNQIVCKASDLVSESMITVEKESIPTQEANDMVDKASDLLVGSVVSDDKVPSAANGMSATPVQMSCLDGDTSTSPTFFSSDERHMKSHGNTEAPLGAEEGKINLSYEIIQGESYDNRNEWDVYKNVAKGRGDGDDYEDGEVRGSLLHCVVEGSCEVGETKNVNSEKASDPVGPMDAHATTQSSDLDGSKILNPGEQKDGLCSTLSSKKNDSGLKTATNAEESLAIGVPNSGSGKKNPSKTVRKVLRNHLGKEKVPETKPVPKKTLHASGEAVAKDNEGDKGSQQVKAGGSNLLPGNHPVLSKIESSINRDVVKNVHSRSNQSRVIHLNSMPNGSSYGRTKSIPGRSLSSRTERGRLDDKSLRGDNKPHLWGYRDDSCVDGFHKGEKGRNQDQPVRKPGSDYMHVRGRFSNHFDAVHVDWDPDSERVSGHFNGPNIFRLPKVKNTSEVAFTAGPDGLIESAGRAGRKSVNDESKNLPRFPSRRRSPGGREGALPVDIHMVHRTMRDTSPGRCIVGGVPDLLLLNHEEKFARGCTSDMVDPSLFHHHPNFKFQRGENTFIRRERRSLSPIQRRGPVHPAHISSPGPRMRSPRLWSPPQISPDGFNGHPELIHCRSPPILRVGRMRSPHQRGCFPEDMLDRRPGSPHYMSRLCDDMRDVDPLREDDYPNSSRGLQRHIQRFDLIDPRGNEEEYFGPLHTSQVRELVRDDECVDGRRNNSERHVLARSFRQRYNVVDDVDDGNFHCRVEDGLPRPIRFCPEPSEEFPDGGTSRDIDRSIRSRLGNMPRRLRGMEEQVDNYRADGGPGWRESGFNDVRSKRRRF